LIRNCRFSECDQVRINLFFKEINYPEFASRVYRLPISPRQHTHLFFKLLSKVASDSGKSIILEKTPDHIDYLSYVENYLPSARIIHIVREGKDTIASHYSISKQNPKIWGHNYHPELDYYIDYWINAIQISLQHKDKSNHCIVRYESLIQNTQSILENLCEFLEIEFQPSMLINYRQTSARLTTSSETWKSSNQDEIKRNQASKFDTALSATEQQQILERIQDFDLDKLFPEL
jgi:hypothetical protein